MLPLRIGSNLTVGSAENIQPASMNCYLHFILTDYALLAFNNCIRANFRVFKRLRLLYNYLR